MPVLLVTTITSVEDVKEKDGVSTADVELSGSTTTTDSRRAKADDDGTV